jgi:hypothetical protein
VSTWWVVATWHPPIGRLHTRSSQQPSHTRTSLRPLQTHFKSRDHEIVRAQKKVSKGHPTTPPKSCSVVTDPQKCSVKSYVTEPSTKCSFNEFLFMLVLVHGKNKSMVVSIRSVMVSRFCVRPISKRWFLKIILVNMKHDPFDAM